WIGMARCRFGHLQFLPCMLRQLRCLDGCQHTGRIGSISGLLVPASIRDPIYGAAEQDGPRNRSDSPPTVRPDCVVISLTLWVFPPRPGLNPTPVSAEPRRVWTGGSPTR